MATKRSILSTLYLLGGAVGGFAGLAAFIFSVFFTGEDPKSIEDETKLIRDLHASTKEVEALAKGNQAILVRLVRDQDEAKTRSPETTEIPFERMHVNNHCQNGTTAIKWRVDARDGWRIVVESITPETIRPVHVSSKASYGGITDLSDEGFTVTGSVANNGDCIKVLGKVVARDGRGALRVAGTYVEEKLDD